jgi:cytochrome c oxidase subunit 1
MAVGTGSLTLTVATGLLLFVVAWAVANVENWRSYTPASDGGAFGRRE